MAEKQSPLIVAVFDDIAQAKHAYNDLRSAGFGEDYLGMADPSQDGGSIGKHLVHGGVPEQDSQFYEQEFGAGHPLVTLRVGGVHKTAIQKAIDILRRDGAYDANSRRHQKGKFASNVDTNANPPFFDIAPGAPDP